MTTVRIYFKMGRMSVITGITVPAHKVLDVLNKTKSGFVSFSSPRQELIAAVSDISHIEVIIENEYQTSS